ncbi:triose-phosphate isomerase [Candidatus Bipolaricaulota bacterium]
MKWGPTLPNADTIAESDAQPSNRPTSVVNIHPIQRNNPHASSKFVNCEVLLIPSFTSLDRAGQLLSGSRMLLGAQDTHFEASGAFTGATSPGMLRACGCVYVLVGHSERRYVFGDSNDVVNQKLHAALENKLRPIFCVGEILSERQADRTELVLKEQLVGGLKGVDSAQLADIVIAYEPVWAIGTGETATPDQAQSAIAFVRDWIEPRYGKPVSDTMRILYGGSVNPGNALALQTQPDIDGALVGGASLEFDSFAQIIEAAQSLQEDVESC